MTQFDLRKSQNEIQEHHNPTDAVYSFTTNFNFKQVKVQKKKQKQDILAHREGISRADVLWYCCIIKFYDTVVWYRERALAVFSSWTVTELLAFWKRRCRLWKCSWLRWSLFCIYRYINYGYLDNNWFFFKEQSQHGWNKDRRIKRRHRLHSSGGSKRHSQIS